MKRLCILMVVLFVWTGCSDDVVDGDATDDNVRDNGNTETAPNTGECEPGEVIGCEDDHSVNVCGESGEPEVEQCPEETPNCFGGECTDMICEPGQPACADETTQAYCNDDGTGYVDEIDCQDGQICEGGVCETACELGPKMTESYFGCEYWTAYLDQYDDPTTGIEDNEVPHAIVLSNPNEIDATAHFQAFEPGVSFDIDDPVIPAGESRAFVMPRIPLEESGISYGGIFVHTTMPVTAHQFNPLNNDNVYSNDASLLLPVSSLGEEYYVLSWPTQGVDFDDFDFDFPGMWNDFDFDPDDMEPQQGFLTVIATSPGTTNVTVNPTADIEEGSDMESLAAGQDHHFELTYGEVLNLQADVSDMGGEFNDLTGTYVTADRSVAVFGGHEQAVVAYDDDRESCCADHIEQQMYPLDSWGDRYIAPFSPGRTQTKDHWRILAGEDGVTVNTEPAQPEADGVTLNAGEFVEFFSDEDFEVQADGKVKVGQYLTSQQQTAEYIGDPALVTAVPIERFRDDYHVLVPQDYERNYITVIRPAGVAVEMNGEPIDDGQFEPVGSGEFETGYVEVNSGVYVLESADEEQFGVLVHGLDNAVSYGYPGGLNVVGADDE